MVPFISLKEGVKLTEYTSKKGEDPIVVEGKKEEIKDADE